MVLSRVILTGAAGMVGRQMLDSLADRGLACGALDRVRPSYLEDRANWIDCDLTSIKQPTELDSLLGDADAILHTAAYVPGKADDLLTSQVFDINVRAALILGEWALSRDIPMVHISSSVVYAMYERKGISETDELNHFGSSDSYRWSKIMAEETLEYLTRQGLSLVILRPSSIYGYGLPKDKMIPHFLDIASRGEVIELTAPVEDEINLIHTRDVAEAALKALDCDARGIFNIASARESSVLEIAEACIKVAGKGSINIGNSQAVREPIVRFGLSSDSAKKSFGFEAKTSLEQGLRLVRAERSKQEESN